LKTSLKQLSQEVIVAGDTFTALTDETVGTLSEGAPRTERGRMRICAHGSADDPLHEMIIALARSTYIRPHRHGVKSESVHVIAGYGELVRFDDGGRVVDVLRIGSYGSGECFYYRMSEPQYHMLVVRSDVLIVHETTNGPFRPADTEFAPWAPDDTDASGRNAFLARVENEVAAYNKASTETT
jgi:cupin fold WbuC family metalloprotein